MLAALARLLAAFGSSSVEVFEWKEADIRKARLPKGPTWAGLTTKRLDMHFTGWQLAHAVVKADHLIERDLLLPGLGFILQVDRIVDLSGGSNLKLAAGGPASLTDFTRTSLCGRIGQGLSLLFAHREGYRFVCHLASHPAVASHIATLPKKQKKAADFLFEHVHGMRMILESKASFLQAANVPTPIKSTLRAALTGQIDYWMSRVSPAASKGYAVYSCLRESGNPVPSALIFVDPPRQRPRRPIDFPEGEVRKYNYAAWLRAMGLTESARNLVRSEKTPPTRIILPVVEIGSQRFALSAQSIPDSFGKWVGIGLDVRVLKAISSSLNSDDGPLLAYEGMPADSFTPSLPEYGSISIFPDGSFLGRIPRKARSVRFEEFYL